jgi:hypothetical protein
MGRIIQIQKAEGNYFSADLSKCAPGIYLLNIDSASLHAFRKLQKN